MVTKLLDRSPGRPLGRDERRRAEPLRAGVGNLHPLPARSGGPRQPGRTTTVTAISEDSDGALWVGTDGGLDRLDRAAGRFTHFLNDAANPDGLSSDHVTAMVEDSAGDLWVGTSDSGLNRLEAANARHRTARPLASSTTAITQAIQAA